MKATSRNNHETEIKLRVPDVQTARRNLQRAGFRPLKRRIFEQNTVFDTPGLKLRKGGSLLRVRQAGKTATVTFKGRSLPGPHKSREELETNINDPELLATILERLGYRPVWRYEKFRTEYRYGAGVATVDETPIGIFVELEGPPEWIDRTARRLNFSPSEYLKASYAGLYRQWCRDHRVKPAHMVFAA